MIRLGDYEQEQIQQVGAEGSGPRLQCRAFFSLYSRSFAVNQIVEGWSLRNERAHAQTAVVDSSHLTSQQREQVRRRVARTLDYLNRLCSRMQMLRFPEGDPLDRSAHRARDAVQNLLAELRSAGGQSKK